MKTSELVNDTSLQAKINKTRKRQLNNKVAKQTRKSQRKGK